MSESTNGQDGITTEPGLESALAEYEDPVDVFEQSGPVALDPMFEALGDPGRRYVLTYLLLREEYVSLSELVDYVVELRDESESRGRFRAELVRDLVQTHLPMLADVGLIDYRIERQFVGPTEKTATVLPYLYLALEQVKASELDDE